jgi:hypothetical protein
MSYYRGTVILDPFIDSLAPGPKEVPKSYTTPSQVYSYSMRQGPEDQMDQPTSEALQMSKEILEHAQEIADFISQEWPKIETTINSQIDAAQQEQEWDTVETLRKELEWRNVLTNREVKLRELARTARLPVKIHLPSSNDFSMEKDLLKLSRETNEEAITSLRRKYLS